MKTTNIATAWHRYYSTERAAHYAGYRTSKAVCEHCGEETTCHSQHCGTTRCIACEAA